MHDSPSPFGLTAREAAARLQAEGYNELASAEGRSLLATLLTVLREPMLLLLISCAVIYFVLGDHREAVLLGSFVLFVLFITLYQDRRTEHAVAALRELSSPRALVIRDGQTQRINARELVRGDLLVLTEGDRIAADAVLQRCTNLCVNESLLTGEPVPVRKAAFNGEQLASHPGGDDLPLVYAGTLVVSGHGVAEIRATGMHTEMGKVGKALATVSEPPSSLDQEITGLVRRIAIGGICFCAVLAVVQGLRTSAWLKGLLAGLALAMSILPEELPMILTIFLALGAWRMARQNVLVRRTRAIETLGAATVLCTDKTGTLTQNRMAVVFACIDGRDFAIEPAAATGLPTELHELVLSSVLSSQREPFDPMESALHHLGLRCPPAIMDLGRYKLIREYPLSPQLLAICRVHQVDPKSDYSVVAKGAPEAVSKLCRLSGPAHQALLARADTLAGKGLRVIAVARATHVDGSLPERQQDFAFTLLGLLALADPIRPEVPAAVAACSDAGVRVIMVTGDYPSTARSIAKQAGITLGDEVITGAQLAGMTSAELVQRVRSVNVFARMVPEQKLRLVNALLSAGEIVAMTGDGVNDAPALKAAHIGIAMGGRGTDVAREAAAIILTDDNFASIVNAIRRGRHLFDNLRKAMAYTLAIHVPIAGLALLAPLLGLPVILMPVHIAVLEMLIDPACSLVFESNPEESNIMRRAPRSPREPLFTHQMVLLGILQGAALLIGCLVVLGLALHHGGNESQVRAQTFCTLMTGNLLLILTNRSWRDSLVRGIFTRSSAVLWILSALALLLGALALYVPAVQRLFGFAAMTAQELGGALGAGFISVLWFELFKLLRHRAVA